MGAVESRRRWAYRLIGRCGMPPPVYGSGEWLALPEGDERKVAAVVIAAEAWACDGDELEARLRREVESAREAFKRDEDADYQARRDAWREEWADLPAEADKARLRAEQREAWLRGEVA